MVAPTVDAQHSFAIVVDKATFDACRTELTAYQEAVEKEGLATAIVAGEWQTPEEVAELLKTYHAQKGLDGAVLVGNIPIAMIRRAQHMTSAFKMDQRDDDMFNTSVPSDRFYDDFDLKFQYLSRQDTLGYKYFYYNLSGDGAQQIDCDIYTGRIKPSLDGEEGYDQIRRYLRKAIAQKSRTDYLDTVVSYTGHGSFSNSLAAWKDETVTLEEQMPAAFRTADGAKFYIFAMYPFVKELLLKELQREGVDMFLFHEHGVPDRQYIASEPEIDSGDPEELYNDARRKARQNMRQRIRYGATPEEASKEICEATGIDPSWTTDYNDPAMLAADSLYDLRTGIILPDLRAINPEPLVALFDACYNGDFREKDCVASTYIFSDGNSLVGLGNSVNVLQDKSSSDLFGMLSAGYNIGEVMQLTNILESHIIGDPTFHFTSNVDFERPDLHNTDSDYWLGYLDTKYPCDIQGLALHKLFNLNYEGLSKILLDTFQSSPYYMLRLQCMHLAAFYADGTYSAIIEKGLDDPYEYIRRKAANYAGYIGEEKFVDKLVDLYLSDYMSERVLFNVWFSIGFFPQGEVYNALKAAIESSDFIFDKEAFAAENLAKAESYGATAAATLEAVCGEGASPRKARFYMNSIRNNPYPYMAADFIKVIENPATDPQLRITLTEALGWYGRAPQKVEIIAACQRILQNEPNMEFAFKDELQKTINRLTNFTR